MYNFYLFLVLVIMLGPLKVYLRQNIVRNISVVEEILFTNVIMLTFFSLYYIFVECGDVKDYFNRLVTKKELVLNLAFYDFCLIAGTLLTGYMLQKESVVYGETLRLGGYLLLITIISAIYKKTFNRYYFGGIIFIILGVYFTELGKSHSD